MSLVEVLPVEPVIPTTLRSPRSRAGPPMLAPAARAPASGIVDGQHAHAAARHARDLQGVLVRDQHAPGARLDRLPGELAAVDVLARDADEQVARSHLARVDDSPAGRVLRNGGARPAREQGGAADLPDPLWS